MASVGEIFERGMRIRLWCFRCFRNDIMSAQAMARHWRRDLADLRPRCRQCRRSDQTLALPATDRLYLPPGRQGEAHALAVERFFHTMRAQRRR